MDLFPNIADLRICFEPNVTGTFEIAGPQSAHIGSTNGQHRPKSPKKTFFGRKSATKFVKWSVMAKNRFVTKISRLSMFFTVLSCTSAVYGRKTVTNTVILILVKKSIFAIRLILKVDRNNLLVILIKCYNILTTFDEIIYDLNQKAEFSG